MAQENLKPLRPPFSGNEGGARGVESEARNEEAEGRAEELQGKIMGWLHGGMALPLTPLEPLKPDNALVLLQAVLTALGEISTTIEDIVERLAELEAILTVLGEAPSTAELEEEEEEEEEEDGEEDGEPAEKPSRGRRKRST